MLPEAAEGSLKLPRLLSRTGHRAQLLALVAGLTIAAGLTAIWLLRADFSDVEYWKRLGYPGVFFLSLVASSTVVVPVPGILAVCGAGSLELNILAVGLVSGVGATIGELSSYAIGFGGSGVIERRSFYKKVTEWMRRRGTVILFVASVIPNPLFDVVGIAAGGTRFPLTRFLITVSIGKTLKGMLVAYGCLQGAELLQWL